MIDDNDLADLLGPPPLSEEPEIVEELVDAAPPKSRPMGANSRALLERSRSYPVSRAARKNTPERLNRLLRNVVEVPIASDAARRAGISLSQLKYWLQKSLEGRSGDGFDVALPDGEENGTADSTVRFHFAWDEALSAGVSRAEVVAWELATGFNEVQSHKGRVQYRIDPEKYDLFVMLGDPIDERNPQLWLRDRFGAPVPETIRKQDPDMVRWVLETRMPKIYGKKATVDMNVTGGVLVVGMRAATSEALNVIEENYRKEGRPSVTFEESDEVE